MTGYWPTVQTIKRVMCALFQLGQLQRVYTDWKLLTFQPGKHNNPDKELCNMLKKKIPDPSNVAYVILQISRTRMFYEVYMIIRSQLPWWIEKSGWSTGFHKQFCLGKVELKVIVFYPARNVCQICWDTSSYPLIIRLEWEIEFSAISIPAIGKDMSLNDRS